jgi:hypothetical protein
VLALLFAVFWEAVTHTQASLHTTLPPFVVILLSHFNAPHLGLAEYTEQRNLHYNAVIDVTWSQFLRMKSTFAVVDR